MMAVTLALVGFFAFVIMRVSQPAMGVLFGDLSASDAGAVMKELDARGVRYESRDEGATILTPRADVSRLRMELAAKSLPSGGGVGYEIFDKGDAFSTTSFVQGINQLRALEGELARTIRSISRVQAARVHLALPERRLFERDREPPRASVALRTRGELGADQVGAIRHLIASAVQGLSPDRISIVDERGRLLAGAGAGDVAAVSGAAEDRRTAIERRLRGQVEEILAGIVGAGRSRVQVAADLELNRVESRSESFDPESRVVRSSQTRGENSATSSSEGQVSVGNELPGARDGAAPPARDATSKTEEVLNYEISRTTRTELLEPGRVRRLSVAVVVDGTYVKGAGGEPSYQPRSKEDLDRIAALVRSAIGFDKGRGDQVEVVNLPLAEGPTALPAEPASFWAGLVSFTRDDLMRFIEFGTISILTLLVLLFVVRPMVRRVVAPDGGWAEAVGRALGSGEPAPALAAPGAGAPAAQLAAAPAHPATEAGAIPAPGGPAALAGAARGADAAGGASPTPAEQIARLGELARANPKEAASVLRGWIGQ